MEKNKIKGGEFIIKETMAKDIFIPEQWSEEQLMMKKTCEDFINQEVTPHLDRIDLQEEGLMVSILDKAGELGLLGVSIPEDLGGMGFDFVTSMLVTEIIGAGHSVAVALSAHTGIGTLPILYYGNEEQKKKYIPKLATAEWKACYCLTEPTSGSDANSGKTSAKLSPDGKHYLITGQKMWITNSGFAEIFIVFAKIDDDKNLSAFIVEKSFGGITLNPEEHKMGIKGSSTRQVFFNDCKVPIENLLSERGNGFKIAVNILNIGRVKLAGAAIGAAKSTISIAVKYANERIQFERPISKYGAIRYKLAEQATRTFASESSIYRASQNIEDAIHSLIEGGMDEASAKLKGIEQFAIEAAILKVNGSETLDYVVDEGVQIYGGMGYSSEGPMDRIYRDSRINRIFEGTNEINRLLIVDMLLKRGMKGEIDLMNPAKMVAAELVGIPEFAEADNTLFSYEKKLIANFKKSILLVAGAAVQKLMTTLSKEQEVIINISDMIIDTYIAESTLLRVEKLVEMKGESGNEAQLYMMRLTVNSSCDNIWVNGKEALNSFVEGDELKMMLIGLKRFTKQDPFNAKSARQIVAQKLITENKYCF